jgi:FixJ family two-component response regulator
MRNVRPLIAVIDDEEPIRRALSRLLRAAALETRTYACGGDFLDSIKDCRFDCAVLDVHMPQVSGFDVLAFLAQIGSKIPVIVITGRDSDETRARAIAAGAVAYLCKPVDEAALLSAVAVAAEREQDETTK